MRQTQFTFIKDYKEEFGGSLQVGKRKIKRPLSTHHPIHLILKSTKLKVFGPKQKIIRELIARECGRFKIKIYDSSPNWSHIHMVIKLQRREDYTKFIRSLTAQLVQKLSAFYKQDLTGLFDLRPYTKIISWGRQLKRVFSYQILNKAEALEGKAYREFVRTVLEHDPSHPITSLPKT